MRSVWHIAVNMLVLFFFGRDVEGIYGRMEFLRIYLCLVVLSSLAWVMSQTVLDPGNSGTMVGASGAVMGVLVLFVLHFPRRLIYIWGVIPVPAWVLAILYVAQDLFGMTSSPDPMAREHVAHATHLAGAVRVVVLV